jgi:hypothetical protein
MYLDVLFHLSHITALVERKSVVSFYVYISFDMFVLFCLVLRSNLIACFFTLAK